MKYQVVLRGENFELNLENDINVFGFYTTRVVKAASAEDAETKAVALIKNDQSLQQLLVKGSSYQPMIYLESIYKAKWWKRSGGKGYTFWEIGNESEST